MRCLAPALLLAPVLMACQPAADDTSAPADGPVLSYEDAFIMLPIGGRDVTMGGISITATGGDVTLTGASTSIADTVETHTMAMEDGTMRMRKVDEFGIADGETLALKRGGDHLMLFGVQDGLAAGDTADILFTFETADGVTLTLDAEAEVRALGE